jgi:hypothetical protein
MIIQRGGKIRPVVVQEISDPTTLAASLARRERFDRNADWLEAHGDEMFALYRGKCICIAGQEAFVADTSSEAVAMAREAHPDDDGYYICRVPKEKAIRIYASRQCVAQ